MNSPIGIFDSGLGGLSVAAEVIKQLPNESITCFADNAHGPYGERPLDEICHFALQITQFLLDRGAKAVVMACNMSSAVALEPAREANPDIPILGMIDPGAKAAVDVSDGGAIGVLATTGTVSSKAYVHAVARFDPSARVIQQACPRLVPLVEEGKAESEEAESAVRGCVAPLLAEDCTTIILGCTHYPFLRDQIQSAAGDHVTVVDPAEETVRVLKKILLERGAASDQLISPHAFYTSGETAEFTALGGAFLGTRIDSVTTVTWGVDPDACAGVRVSVARDRRPTTDDR